MKIVNSDQKTVFSVFSCNIFSLIIFFYNSEFTTATSWV